MINNPPYQIQYYHLLANLLASPDKEVESRVGAVKSRFSEKMKVDLRKEFPLMDIKQTSFKNIYVELLWFIKGDTNIKFLVDNGCNIWNDDAFRWYNEKYVSLGAPIVTKEEFIEKTKTQEVIFLNFSESSGTVCVDRVHHLEYPLWFRQSSKEYTYGNLDIVYGRQWRAFGGKVDQLKQVIETLKSNPDDRRIIITAHNPADIADGNVGLPSCHNYMQFYTQPISLNERVSLATKKNVLIPELQELVDVNVFYKFPKGRKIEITKETLNHIGDLLTAQGVPERHLSVLVNIRSNDFFLGNPYNIASYGLFVSMIAQCVGMVPLTLSCEMVDCHLYDKHIEAAEEWIKRMNEVGAANNYGIEEMFCNAKLVINPDVKNIDDFTLADCKVENYKSLGKIVAPLLT